MMLQLGTFQFKTSTAAYQQLQRSDRYRWQAIHGIQRPINYQYMGKGESTIMLNGVIYPQENGGQHQLDHLRGLARSGKVLPLVNGDGRVLGKWAIKNIEETQSLHTKHGEPLKQQFKLTLHRDADGLDTIKGWGSAVQNKIR